MFPSVVQQFYQSEVNNEYVIRGNSAILKCSIPSFVADFVHVVSWQDDAGNTYTPMGNDAQANGIAVRRLTIDLRTFTKGVSLAIPVVIYFCYSSISHFHPIFFQFSLIHPILTQSIPFNFSCQPILRGRSGVRICD